MVARRRLRLALKIGLPEIYPGPISFLKLGIASGEISGLKKNIGIDEERVLRPNGPQSDIGCTAKTLRLFGPNHAHRTAQSRRAIGLRRSIIDDDDFLDRSEIRFE